MTFLVLVQAVKPPELNPETEESLPSRRSPEGPDPPVLTEVTSAPPGNCPPDLESVEKKMDRGRYKSVVRVLGAGGTVDTQGLSESGSMSQKDR